MNTSKRKKKKAEVAQEVVLVEKREDYSKGFKTLKSGNIKKSPLLTYEIKRNQLIGLV